MRRDLAPQTCAYRTSARCDRFSRSRRRDIKIAVTVVESDVPCWRLRRSRSAKVSAIPGFCRVEAATTRAAQRYF